LHEPEQVDPGDVGQPAALGPGTADQQRPGLLRQLSVTPVGRGEDIDALLGHQPTDEHERGFRHGLTARLGDGVEAGVVARVDATDDALVRESEAPGEVC